jgi:PAS domain S-box-containing protein
MPAIQIPTLVLNKWRLQRFPIGVRLRFVFACIVLLMFLGSSFALWYLWGIRTDVERVSLVERRMSAVLQVDNSVLTLMNQLHRVADLRQRDSFEFEATRLMSVFRSDTAGAAGILRSTIADNNRQAVIIESLNGLLKALPDRLETLIGLARADDWVALHARLLNQEDHTDDVVAALVREINADFGESRKRLLAEVERAAVHTAEALAAAGLLSLLLAGLLGIVVTRSITRPLASLDAGARELAQGHFGRQLEITGTDELAQLASVFNQTARELEQLYGQMQLSEARFRSLIENASEVILIVSRTGCIRYASPSTARVLGAPAEKFIGRQIRDLLHGDEVPRADHILRELGGQHGGTQSFEWRLCHQDGSFRSMEGLIANLLDDPAVAGIVINARDVSDRRQAELALREREDQLRQSQKMEAIGKLAGGVAHDFNNLLTVINGYSELLLGALDIRDPRYGYAKDVRLAGEQAAHLTRQLLAYGRKQMLRPAVFNLNDVVRETERMLRRVIGEDIELVCHLDPAICWVEADRSQLQQVLMNLVVNARDAMPGGGRLTIETGTIDCRVPSEGSDAPFRPGPCVTLAVRDTGEGMDEATKGRIFEPFFTTKEMGKGTGLGLSTVYGIVSQSGGRIAVQSEIGKGTTFEIYLPRTDRIGETQITAAHAPSVRGSETILIVEDQPDVRQLACRYLESHGYRVLEAAHADEALRLSATPGEVIHVLFTDVVMPGMNGVELSKRLLASRPGVKVLFASGYADGGMLRHGMEDTEAVLIPKPYQLDTLVAKIRELLA